MLRVFSVLLLQLFCIYSYAFEVSRNDVNFMALVSSPERYKGRSVEVVGVLAFSNDRRGYLFFSKEQYEYRITQNAIRLVGSDGFGKGLDDGRYYSITGDLNFDRDGRFLYLENVRNVYALHEL